MRREPDMQAIPVIILSAKSTPGDIKAGFDAGATKYHTKPVSFLDLKQAVTQVLQKV
jgi:CheY-like chemotaxis protein